ncbi:MAG TPA: oligosaccharide flippase family protein, partial [Ardenticatenaceae bacterium]|nr:oligosaccharide flippase family protein [Ardenticatenaceae bacterium]
MNCYSRHRDTQNVLPAPSRHETPLAFRVVRSGIWLAASSYFNLAFGFGANVALTRLLAPEHAGVFVFAQFLYSLLDLRTKLGVGQAFAQRKQTTGDLVGSLFVLEVGTGVGTVLIVLAALPILRALDYSWDVVAVTLALAVVGLANSITGTAWVLLDKELRFDRVSLVTSIAFPVSYLPAFWLAVRGGGAWSFVAQNATYALLLLAGLWWSAWRTIPHVWALNWRFDRQVAVQLVRFGASIGSATLAASMVYQFDSFLVGQFAGMAALGFYDRAYRLAGWPHLLVGTIASRAGFYTYARLQDDRLRLEKAVTMSFWIINLLAIPLGAGIFVAAPDLVHLLYGERWLPSAPFVRLLVVYSLVRPALENLAA